MNWILEHLQLLFVVGGGIAWWLNQRRQAKEESANPPPAEVVGEDPDLAERTRRIREEIQRKIEQRARGQESSPSRAPTEPPPLIRQEVEQRYETPPPRLPKPAASHYENQRTAEILEQQAALAERLRQAQEMKASALRRAQFEQRVSSRPETVAKAAVRAALTQELRDPEALRRAFILREIIGPPIALR